MLRLVYFGLKLLLEFLLLLATLPFLGGGSYVFVAGVLEVKPLVAGALAGCIVFPRVMRLIRTVPSFFVNSSLSPVLLFRRRLKSVADVLKGIRSKGSRWDALVRYWGAVCRHGPSGPISSLHPWDDWLPPDLHGFYKWVFDSLEVLNGFFRQVVVSRRDEGIRRWKGWLREDLSSRPYAWLRPDFVPPSPFLVVPDPQTQSSHVVVEPHLIDAEFRKGLVALFLQVWSSWGQGWVVISCSSWSLTSSSPLTRWTGKFLIVHLGG